MALICINDDDLDSPKLKALWRRELTKRRGSCTWRKPAMKPRRMSATLAGQPDRSSRESPGRAARSGSQKAAQRRIPLSEWFRSTLWEQANLAGGYEGAGSEEDEEEDEEEEDEEDEEDDEGKDQGREEERGDVKTEQDEHIGLLHGNLARNACSSPSLIAQEFSCSQRTAQPPQKLLVDEAVQCDADAMLEPMATSAMGQKCCLHHLRTAPLCPPTYSAASHFSFFEDASCAVSRAAGLDDGQLRILAGQFLGPSVGGVRIELRKCHNAWRVADRHVADASLLVQHVPHFRASLFTSARRLLLGGLPSEECRALRGQSLLRLAHERPFMWAKLAYTALDFACRLMQEGALPTALALDVLVLIQNQGWNEWVLGLLKILSVIRRAPAHSGKRSTIVRRKSSRSVLGAAKLAEQRPSVQRTMSAPQPGVCLQEGSLARAQTAPPTTFVHRGTSLRPHDVHQANFAAVSFSGASGRLVTHEVIPSEIKGCDLPEYWRSAAGGEHSEADLELRARQAEEAWKFQFQLGT